MNRVVLSGWLTTPPLSARTLGGIRVTLFRLRVPRYDDTGGSDEIECVALRELARDIAEHARPGDRMNLEGRLRMDTFWESAGHQTRSLRVHLDFAYVVLGSPPPAVPASHSVTASPNGRLAA